MISGEAIEEFKEIYAEEIGEEISDEKAMEFGVDLLVFFNHVYRPIKKDWLDKFTEDKN